MSIARDGGTAPNGYPYAIILGTGKAMDFKFCIVNFELS